jgi:hypothetical protein
VKHPQEGRQTDLVFMILGLMTPAIGYGVMGNDITYLPGDIRGQPVYGLAVFLVAILIGLVLFGVGLVRLIQDLRDQRK